MKLYNAIMKETKEFHYSSKLLKLQEKLVIRKWYNIALVLTFVLGLGLTLAFGLK